MVHPTTDISDDLGNEAHVANTGFRDYGGRIIFSGLISTVKCHEDNSLVRVALSEPGHGRVLVVDGGGSTRCALLGDILATLGTTNNWSGLVINGCIRDSVEIATIDIGVKAIATHPRKSVKRGDGERDITVHFAGIDFRPGDQLYADSDGVVVTAWPAEQVL